MPLTAILENDIVCALDAEDKSLNYKCKWCDSAMVLKRGQIKIAHFAHKPNADCPYHKPESEMHLRMKGWISDKLSGSILETRVGNTFFDVRYKDYVFECQASSLSLDEYDQREDCASKNNLTLIWLLATPQFGKTVMEFYGCEHTKVKALELAIFRRKLNAPLYYLEWHPISQKMICFTRHLTTQLETTVTEWGGGEPCKTKWRFEEEMEIKIIDKLAEKA